jgi:hypothetical protein
MYRFILPALLLIGGSAALSADSKDYAARQAAEDKVKLDKALAGLVPGKPQDCMSILNYQDTTRIGDTILYSNTRNDVYRTDMSPGCFGLRNGDTIVSKSYIDQRCRGDIVRTVDLMSHTETGSCTYGDFVHYTKPR